MTRTITIGKGSMSVTRDYATLGAFVADVGVGLPAGPNAPGETQPWEVLCYNDDGTAIQETNIVTTSGLFWDGTTNQSSATNNCIVKPAAGNGANGDPNDHRTRSGPLDYDPAAGVAFEWSGNHEGVWEQNSSTNQAPYLDYAGLQFLHSSINFVRQLFRKRRAQATTVEQCIFKCIPAVDRGSGSEWKGTVVATEANISTQAFINNLIIVSGDATHRPASTAKGFTGGFLLSQFYNNTIVNEIHATTTDIIGALGTSATSTAVFANNLILGFDTAWDNGGDNDGTQEYTVTDASAANTDGSNNTTSITLTDQLQDITAGSLNARLKAGSDARGAAGGTYIATDDIFGATRDTEEDVGCAEFSGVVGSSLIDGNKLQRGKLVSC